ncbi:MAG: hypothetical protein KGI54_07010 [Pseudomonadota bacterium]|nr:hypothetical protein [Pseudomonadota bacterium]
MIDTLPEEEGHSGWVMKELKPKHKQVCAMLAQGIDRRTISNVVGCTPEYITMLSKQALVKDYITEMCQAAGLQLESMFIQSVEAIGETLANGNHKEKMQAARLQMEATKRIGSGSSIPKEIIDTNDRLARLAERLLFLQSGAVKTIETRRNENGIYQEIERTGLGLDTTAQEDGDGSPNPTGREEGEE